MKVRATIAAARNLRKLILSVVLVKFTFGAIFCCQVGLACLDLALPVLKKSRF